jgi:hypothetical protein
MSKPLARRKGMIGNGKILAIAFVLAALCSAATVAAQPLVVTGTGNATVDVAAVQAAVDHGG